MSAWQQISVWHLANSFVLTCVSGRMQSNGYTILHDMVKQSVGHDCTIHLRRNQTTYCWPNCERQHDCKASRYIIGTLTDTWKSQPCVWLGLPYASCNQLSYHLSPSSGPCELSDFTLCKTDYSSAKMMQLRCHVSSELTIFS